MNPARKLSKIFSKLDSAFLKSTGRSFGCYYQGPYVNALEVSADDQNIQASELDVPEELVQGATVDEVCLKDGRVLGPFTVKRVQPAARGGLITIYLFDADPPDG